MAVTGNLSPATISVAMINYNNAPYLRQAIESVVSQTRLPEELIVSDDGSTDGSLALLEDYATRYPFIRVIRTPRNLGAGGNRDFAIRHVQSRFVINLDSDDWYEPQLIERTLATLKQNPDSVVISSFSVVSETGDTLTTIDTSAFCEAEQSRQVFLLASRQRCMPGNQFALSKANYIQLGGLDSSLKLYEDWDLLLRTCRRGIRFVHTGCVGFSYRKSGTGLSASKQGRHMKYRLVIMFRNLFRWTYLPAFIAGTVTLFFSKGFKYLTRRASPHGYN